MHISCLHDQQDFCWGNASNEPQEPEVCNLGINLRC